MKVFIKKACFARTNRATAKAIRDEFESKQKEIYEQ